MPPKMQQLPIRTIESSKMVGHWEPSHKYHKMPEDYSTRANRRDVKETKIQIK